MFYLGEGPLRFLVPFWFQNGGRKTVPFLVPPLGPPFDPPGPPWERPVALLGPQGVPKWCQNGAKMGPKSDPPEILKTVLSPKRELT